MKISVLKEAGYEEALLGISLSYNSPLSRMPRRAAALAPLDGGHNKFLEHIYVWLDIQAPRYWWSQFDTYRVGTSKQSESTMHTLLSGELKQHHFQYEVPEQILNVLNAYIRAGDLEMAKAILPESFLQRRIVTTNYKVLRNIVHQRSTHKLQEWRVFCSQLGKHLEYPEFIWRKNDETHATS